MALLRTASGIVVVAGIEDVPLPEWVKAPQVKRALERSTDAAPYRVFPWGSGLRLVGRGTQVLLSAIRWGDEGEWVHASISHPASSPSYEELRALHLAVFGERWSYQVFAPPQRHVDGVRNGRLGHPHCLHLWAAMDGAPRLPDFGRYGVL